MILRIDQDIKARKMEDITISMVVKVIMEVKKEGKKVNMADP